MRLSRCTRKVSCHYIGFAAGDRKGSLEYEVVICAFPVIMPGNNFARGERKYARLNIAALQHGFHAFDFIRRSGCSHDLVFLKRRDHKLHGLEIVATTPPRRPSTTASKRSQPVRNLSTMIAAQLRPLPVRVCFGEAPTSVDGDCGRMRWSKSSRSCARNIETGAL
jgi:hypothetical protein